MRSAAVYVLILAVVGGAAWAVLRSDLPPADFAFCNGTEIKTVDPAIVTGQPEGRIVWALFEGLCRWDPKTLSPGELLDEGQIRELPPDERRRLDLQPDEQLWRLRGAAEWCRISEDRLTYTFFIRPAARWSDGSPVTAEDFVYSLRRLLHPGTAAEYAKEMWYVVGAEEYCTSKVEIGEAVEVELHEKHPGALRHAPGVVLHGRLKAIERDGDEEVYLVEIDGRERRFRKTPRPAGPESCKWLLRDVRTVGIREPESPAGTLEITLKHPVPYFLNLMGFYPMSPVHRRSVETHGFPDWTKPENLVSNGPFVLEFRRIRDRIRLRRSPTYWNRENVGLETIDALAVSSVPTMLNLYMSGVVDWIDTVPPEVVPDLLERFPDEFRPSPFLATYYYVMNVREGPLEDVRVRRALGLAIDKREVVERVTRAGQIPARSFVPEKIAQYSLGKDESGRDVYYAPAQGAEYDPAEARRLLAEAGFPGGRGLPRLEILYNTHEAHQAIAELIQAQWKRSLGIDVGLRNQEWGTFLASLRSHQYVIARSGWIGDYVDPNTFLDMWVTGNPQNHTGWSHAEYDALVAAAQRERDLRRRVELFHQAERILMDETPIIPIYFYVTTSMTRPYVRGFYENIQNVHPLEAIWIDAEAKARYWAGEERR
jgi:oligopeptide transport system substrate-binding protein